jgi:predicted dehydrogenase
MTRQGVKSSQLEEPMKRRAFLTGVGGGLAAASVASRAAGAKPGPASDKVGVAVMGLRRRGKPLTQLLSQMPDVEIPYVCDVDQSQIGPAIEIVEKAKGTRPRGVQDFRRALEDPAVHAIVIATPVHWHAAAAILACEAGKDVYLEKPMSHNIREGRMIIDAVKRTNRVIQVGSHARSRPINHRLVEVVQSGAIGTVRMAKVLDLEFRRDIGHKADEPTPAGVDYDIYTGPALLFPFNQNRFHETYQWHWNYGTGEVGDNGAHWLDICRWVLGVGCPTAASGTGRKLGFSDDKQIPDTTDLSFNYDDKVITYEERLWHPYTYQGSQNTMMFYGTEGMVEFGRWVGGYYAFRVYDGNNRLVRYEQEEKPDQGTVPHLRNFLDCVRSRKKPVADVETAHISTTMCHLGNIVVRSGHNIKYDPKTETIPNDPEASRYLGREYRNHWSSVPLKKA